MRFTRLPRTVQSRLAPEDLRFPTRRGFWRLLVTDRIGAISLDNEKTGDENWFEIKGNKTKLGVTTERPQVSIGPWARLFWASTTPPTAAPTCLGRARTTGISFRRLCWHRFHNRCAATTTRKTEPGNAV